MEISFKRIKFKKKSVQVLASKIRGTVSSVTFDDFHKNSASIIHRSVFGEEDTLMFPQNNLKVTSVDIK